jgi:ketosteroid isomerase-like protein
VKRESIELLLDWLAALRGGDVERATAGLAPDVVWLRLGEGAVCAGAEDVARGFRAAHDELRDVEAIELIGQDSSAVLASHQPDGAAVFNVFRFDGSRIVRIEDYETREQALAAATGSSAAA